MAFVSAETRQKRIGTREQPKQGKTERKRGERKERKEEERRKKRGDTAGIFPYNFLTFQVCVSIKNQRGSKMKREIQGLPKRKGKFVIVMTLLS